MKLFCYANIILNLIAFLQISLNALPGSIIGYINETQVPIISLTSLNLEKYKILHTFNVDDLPKQSNWQKHNPYYLNRNRTIYLTEDEKFTLKIWQKDYPSTFKFLSALHAGFYNNIAPIAAIIVDEDNECRGYVLPYLIDRTFHRTQWESCEFVLEKGPINVRIFSDHHKQPIIYKQLFDELINKIHTLGYISLDFCPNNVAVNLEEKKAYLVDLEDVFFLNELNDPLIIEIFFKYLSNDYIKYLT